jgi:hypothetical protein
LMFCCACILPWFKIFVALMFTVVPCIIGAAPVQLMVLSKTFATTGAVIESVPELMMLPAL